MSLNNQLTNKLKAEQDATKKEDSNDGFVLVNNPGINISHENQNFSEADPKNFKTFPNKKNPKGKLQ